MEEQKEALKDVFDKIENYTKTTIELYKLKFVGKSSSVVSILVLYATIFIFALFFTAFISITLALLIGKWIGAYYLSFLVVSIIYLITACLVFMFKDKIAQKLQNTILLKILISNDKDEK